MSWNPGNYAPPPGPPPQGGGWAPPPGGPPGPGGFGFPSPTQFGAPGAPAPEPWGYQPPPGPPPAGFPNAQSPAGFAPPPGPPPGAAPGGAATGDRGFGGFPGQIMQAIRPPGGGGYGAGGPGGYGAGGAGGYGPPPQQQHGYGGGHGGYGAGGPGGYGGHQGGYGAGGPQGYGVITPPPSGPAHMPPSGVQHYGPNAQGGQPFFQYSQCNGKKKALCIGINYKGQNGELRGCINDARNVQNFLIRQYGYKAEDIVMLTDDSTNPRQKPTRRNILEGMQWLVAGAHPNDSLFFHYSGHGGQTKDHDGDEADGHDEVIYPLDHETAGEIVDDQMHDIMVKPLPPGCRLTAIFDSCHSGSVLDLPYIYSTEGKLKEPNLLADAGSGLLQSGLAYMRGDKKAALKGMVGMVKTAASTKKSDKISKSTRTSAADVISWSGCKDSQTSADTVEAGQSTGAMSFAFISSLSANPNQTYQQLLNSIRDILRSKYSQKPQLSSSHPMDTTILFIA